MWRNLLKLLQKINDLKGHMIDYFSFRNHGTLAIKAITFVLLFWLYLQAYFIPQAIEFTKHRTTFTTTLEGAGSVKMPNLIICTNPGLKASKRNVFGRSYYSAEDLLADRDDTYLTFNKTMWQAFETLTYNFETDFHLYHHYVTDVF